MTLRPPAPDGTVLDPDEVDRILNRMAAEMVEALSGASSMGLVGIRRGGVPVAQRLARLIEEQTGAPIPTGAIDISLYRDDAATALPDPKIGPSAIAFDLRGGDIVLVDDVLQTGRTVRAGIDCLLDYGRPRRIWLAALVDRGGRELPIAADFTGRTIEAEDAERLEIEEREGRLTLALRRVQGAP